MHLGYNWEIGYCRSDRMNCPLDEAPHNSILEPTAFAGKCLSPTEKRYSNTEREQLEILHRLEKFHHYALPES